MFVQPSSRIGSLSPTRSAHGVTATRYDGSHAAWGLFTVLEPGRRMVDEAVKWLRERMRT